MPPPEAGTIVGERYQIIKALGHGGFAETYLAQDLKEDKKVALKLPDLSQLGDPAIYERFRRELSIGKLLQHPDLTVAIDYSEGSPPYLVFNYLEEETLAKLLDDKRLFPIGQTVEMVACLLDALSYCHSKGVYHRDIKPENLMVGRDGHLKIIDFGIAVMSNSPRVTWRGFSGLIGTPEYMSPEQIKGERGNEKSDIYAVGCLLYHMIAGYPPFSGDNPMTIMYQHLTSSPKPLNEIRPDIHPGIWACVCHAMRRRKAERYDTALEMAEDLRSLDKVDLKYIKMIDPPMVAVAQSKHFNRNLWLIIGIIAAAAAGLGLLAFFLNRL
ncbi:MAG: serine/threonine-protein kinase [Clostridia bacterium]|nr:serine/threonine-protein kinase [Clostridia bacterium]